MKLLDSCVLQLMKTMLETFGVDNIQLLQLKAIGVVCAVRINVSVPSDLCSVLLLYYKVVIGSIYNFTLFNCVHYLLVN